MANPEIVRQINDAIGMHGAWKMKLRVAIKSGHCETSAADAACDDRCPLGKWLYGPELDAGIRAGIPYGVVRRLHAEFHQAASGVLAHVERGDPSGAAAAMDGNFGERADKLVRALTKWKGEAAAA